MELKIEHIGDLLPQGKFKVHSRFNRIANFLNEKNEILSVAQEKSFLAPNVIILNSSETYNIDNLEIQADKIEVNETACFNDWQIFNSKIDIQSIDKENLLKKIGTIEDRFIDECSPKSLTFLLDEKRESFFTSSFEKAFVKYMKHAYQMILSSELSGGVKAMKGSGFGLTPSGDDFICGMLYGLEINAQLNNLSVQNLKQEIYKVAKGKNYISNSMLYYASIGRYNKRVKNLQNSLISNVGELEESVKALLNHGETSGADMLTGYITTIKNNIGYDKRNN